MSGTRAVLVTGAAGYIGSHACVALVAAGHRVVGIDNFENSSPVAIDRVRELAGPIEFAAGDIADEALVGKLIADHGIDSVMHFAGRKAVGESVEQPLGYYRVNVVGTLALLRQMAAAGVHELVFSSSCTVYGDPESGGAALDESTPIRPVNPYGHSKRFVEQILIDLTASDPRWRVLSLRYFNPVGAHPSGRLGEDPRGVPNNLMPYVMQVGVGRRPIVQVFGGDYDTPDGTCVRDYIHVVDLVEGHVAAIEALDSTSGFAAVNLGTGVGSSVLEVIAAAERAIGHEVPYELVGRRPGDAASVFADPSLAGEFLGWTSERDLARMCVDHWRWQSANPEGYGAAVESSTSSPTSLDPAGAGS